MKKYVVCTVALLLLFACIMIIIAYISESVFNAISACGFGLFCGICSAKLARWITSNKESGGEPW